VPVFSDTFEPDTQGVQPAACAAAVSTFDQRWLVESGCMFWSRKASESTPAATAIMSISCASANTVCGAPGARSGPLWNMPYCEPTGLLISW
jgi:hypothetical protein